MASTIYEVLRACVHYILKFEFTCSFFHEFFWSNAGCSHSQARRRKSETVFASISCGRASLVALGLALTLSARFTAQTQLASTATGQQGQRTGEGDCFHINLSFDVDCLTSCLLASSVLCWVYLFMSAVPITAAYDWTIGWYHRTSRLPSSMLSCVTTCMGRTTVRWGSI